MKRQDKINQIQSSINHFTESASELEKEVLTGEAAEYEQRVGKESGYIAELAQDYRETADKLQQKLNSIKQ